MRLVWIALAMIGCAAARPPRAAVLLDRCRARPPSDGQAPWHWQPGLRCQAARATDGGIVQLDDASPMLRRTNPDGTLRWEADTRDDRGRACGAPQGLAIDRDGAVALACGYSLLGFAPDGTRRWQIWPGGNFHVGGPVVDDGVVYVTAGGALHAIARDGKAIWSAGFGGRSASAIGVTPEGGFVLETTEDVWFGDDGTVFHPDEAPELMIIGRDGAVIERRARHHGEPWPAWIPVVDDGGSRIPPP